MTVVRPVEQLRFTHDETDYCWYETALDVPPGPQSTGYLALEGFGDVAHVFVDGMLVGTTARPMPEQGSFFDGPGQRQHLHVDVAPGMHRLAIMCCALGLRKEDWNVGDRHYNLAEERKGIWGDVTWNGELLRGTWTIMPGLVGERLGAHGNARAFVRWRPSGDGGRGKALVWWCASFDCPSVDWPLALDLFGMTKGMVWLNGRCLGRYWLAPAVCRTRDWLAPPISHSGMEAPTQRLYHLPREWLETHNTLALFEELGGDPTLITLRAIGHVRAAARDSEASS